MKRPLFEFILSAWRAWAAMLLAGCLAAACGGGVDSGGTGAPANTFSTGHISGFGSIVVNGVHYDDSHAALLDDDGAARASSDLKLGMTVDVDAGAISTDAATSTPQATASKVQFGYAILGPVQAVDAANSRLTVLGQAVAVDADTVFDGITGGVAGVHVGNLVGVFALFDTATGLYSASRIELKTNAGEYRLRGIVSSLDTAAKTFAIGAAVISYAGVPSADVPTLANGSVVRIKLATTQTGGVWMLSHGLAATPGIPEGTKAEIEGFIADFTSTARFKVNGTLVDASGSGVVFKDGSAGQLANGVRVEIEGTMHAGVLQAQKVEFKPSGKPGHQEEIDLKGKIDSVDAAQQSFVLRGSTVVYDASTQFDGGMASDLAAGVEVKVEGVVTGNGTQVLATKIKIGK